jgi:ribosomal 30S subunit maturation factor RimM
MRETADATARAPGGPAEAGALVAVGRIVRSQGRRGEVRLEPLTDAPERLGELTECWLVPPAAGERRGIEGVWFQGRVPVV